MQNLMSKKTSKIMTTHLKKGAQIDAKTHNKINAETGNEKIMEIIKLMFL